MGSDRRWDVCVAREDESGKTHWTRIGVMFANKNNGFGIYLDALPATGGRMTAFLHQESGSDGDSARGRARSER